MVMNAKHNDNPLVSIIMPVLNAAEFLPAALNSVLVQTYQNIEIICVDDGSTDDSYSVLKRYQKWNPNIRVYKNDKNLGVSHTSNFAISKAHGRFIARFDADDVMTVDRIEKQVAYLKAHPEVVVVGGQVELMDYRGNKIGDKKFPLDWKTIYETLFTMMPVQQGSMMVNASMLPHGFVWYKGDNLTAEEVDLFFRLFKYGKFANLNDVVLKYRQYGSSTSLKDPKKTFYVTYETRMRAVKKYGYKPTFKAYLVNFIEYVLVTALPKNLIYPLFSLLRGMSDVKAKVLALPSTSSIPNN